MCCDHPCPDGDWEAWTRVPPTHHAHLPTSCHNHTVGGPHEATAHPHPLHPRHTSSSDEELGPASSSPTPLTARSLVISLGASRSEAGSRPASAAARLFSQYSMLVLVCLCLCLPHCAESCSSRSTPKPRPPSQNAMRPNITFQTYACPPAYAAWYCLNGATCFTVKIADSILYNCECADGYMGQRCEFKDLDGTYMRKAARERLMMIKNSKVGQVLILGIAVIVTVVIISAIATKIRTRIKLRTIATATVNQLRQNQFSSIGMGDNVLPAGDIMGQSISYQLSSGCQDNDVSSYQPWPRRPAYEGESRSRTAVAGVSGTSVLMRGANVLDQASTSFCNPRASLTTARRAPMMQSRIS